MPAGSFSVRPSLLLFSFWVWFFALILASGYALSFLGLTPHPVLVLILVGLECASLAIWLVRQPIRVAGDPLELAGMLLVVVGTWLYFVSPSWPTLLPPSYSGDAANHYSYISRTFLTGHIVNDYPGGPAFIAAVMAHWIGWSPLRLLHLLGASWIALTAGAVYGLACAMLPPRSTSKIVALLAPIALFITSDYFVETLIGPAYFWTEVASQFGYRLPSKSPLHPGESLKVYLYWQSIGVPPRDFTAFVHLLDASGALCAQSDAAPRNGTYPTSVWTPGEIVLDARTLTLPPDAPPGTYHLEIGMYEWPSLQRLPMTDAANRAQGDHYVLPEAVRVIGR